MAKLNLQLFAVKLNLKGIDDKDKPKGKETEKKKATTGAGVPSTSKGTSTGTSTGTSAGTSAGSTGNVKTTTGAGQGVAQGVAHGVSQGVSNKLNSSYKSSDAVTGAQKDADGLRDKLTQLGSVTDLIDQSTWDAINTPFKESSAYQDAMALTNQLKEQLTSGRTSYTDQISAMINKIQNRDAFEYDMSKDTLFQQSLASAMASGQTAMQDTIGQASALTGGYASTYATSAGNQAYNAYIQDAYNNLPEYYQMAMEAYQMEGQDMYNQLSMLSDADATEYQRMYDAWNVNNTSAQQMYAQEYGAWQDSVSNALNSAGLQMQEHGQIYDQTYNTYGAVQGHADTLYAQEYQKWADEVNNAMNIAGMQNNDYWNNEEMKYKQGALAQDQSQFVSQYDVNGDGKVDSKDIQAKRQWDLDDMNTQMAWEKEQFNAKYDVNGDGKVDAKDQVAEGSGGSGGSGGSYKTPTETQKQKALEAYNTGGEDAYYQYIDSLPSDIDVEEIDTYVNGDGAENKGYGTLPLAKRTFTKTKDTINWLWGVDNNDLVEDQYGNSYRIDALPKEIRDALTKLKKGESYTAK